MNMTSPPTPGQTLDDAQADHASQALCRIVVCGGAGSGKRTLIDHLLAATNRERPAPPAAHASAPLGHTPDATADLLDRGLSTARRRFIIADAAGHTARVVVGAFAADAAVLLVDALAGAGREAYRDALIASVAGVRHLVLATNKMDLAAFDQARYDAIRRDLTSFTRSLGFASVTAIPVSALHGDNVTRRSARTDWYEGSTLLACLETLDLAHPPSSRLVFPVQQVVRAGTHFSGTVAEGSIRSGDEIRVTASGHTARVADILTMDGASDEAGRGDAVTLQLDRGIDADRGDVFSLARAPLETTDQFEATLIWMHEDAGLVGRSYDIQLATQWAQASITTIKHRIDVDTLAHEACRTLARDDVAVCNLATDKALCFDTYAESHTLGGFIMVDRYSRATVAAGMIRHSLRRAQNVHRQALSIARGDRERLNGHAGKVVWFTGLSGSGKSTLANALEVALHAQGLRTYILDGDNVRHGLNKDLGFTDADRVENIRRIAEVARLMLDAGLIVMTAFISPFRRERDMARELIGAEHFIEVFVDTPLAVCEQRDPKGLYKKARSGQLPNMTGINSPYEAPERPDVVIEGATADLPGALRTLTAALGIPLQAPDAPARHQAVRPEPHPED